MAFGQRHAAVEHPLPVDVAGPGRHREEHRLHARARGRDEAVDDRPRVPELHRRRRRRAGSRPRSGPRSSRGCRRSRTTWDPTEPVPPQPEHPAERERDVTSRSMPERIDADVCVVGAGYAGLTAAAPTVQAGRSVVVLEARDRVGGRIWTQQLSDGSPVDRGGAWLGPKHDAIFGLAAEIGVSTYKTWVKGAHLLVDGDRTRRYTGLIPKISPLAVAHDRVGAAEARSHGQAGPARRAVDGEARRRVGLALGGLVARALRDPHAASRATCSRWRCAACSPAT